MCLICSCITYPIENMYSKYFQEFTKRAHSEPDCQHITVWHVSLGPSTSYPAPIPQHLLLLLIGPHKRIILIHVPPSLYMCPHLSQNHWPNKNTHLFSKKKSSSSSLLLECIQSAMHRVQWFIGLIYWNSSKMVCAISHLGIMNATKWEYSHRFIQPVCGEIETQV